MEYSAGFYLRRSLGLLLALLLAWAITTLVEDRGNLIGWIYLGLFVLAGILTFMARGTYLWILAVWLGAMLVVIFGPRNYPGDLWVSAVILGAQYLSAVLTGGLLGQWLRYQLARRRGAALPLLPGANMLLVSGLFLLLLPVLAFLLLARVSIQNESLATILMFIPGHTPFLLPALLTGALSGYWVRQMSRDIRERRRGLLLIVLSLLLFGLALGLRFVFGYLEVHGLLPA